MITRAKREPNSTFAIHRHTPPAHTSANGSRLPFPPCAQFKLSPSSFSLSFGKWVEKTNSRWVPESCWISILRSSNSSPFWLILPEAFARLLRV